MCAKHLALGECTTLSRTMQCIERWIEEVLQKKLYPPKKLTHSLPVCLYCLCNLSKHCSCRNGRAFIFDKILSKTQFFSTKFFLSHPKQQVHNKKNINLCKNGVKNHESLSYLGIVSNPHHEKCRDMEKNDV